MAGMGLVAVVGCAMLAGCAFISPSTRLADLGARFTGPPPAKMGVAQGAVVVAGPKGFCIDREVSHDASGQQALTVLSACRDLGGGRFQARPDHPAVLTAAVSPQGQSFAVEGAEAQLQGFFASDHGRALISRNGVADSVQISEAFVQDGAYVLHLTDSAPFSWGAVQAEYWRTLFPLGGRMVTLAVLALPDAPLSREQGLQLLVDFTAATRGASQARVESLAAQSAIAPVAATKP